MSVKNLWENDIIHIEFLKIFILVGDCILACSSFSGFPACNLRINILIQISVLSLCQWYMIISHYAINRLRSISKINRWVALSKLCMCLYNIGIESMLTSFHYSTKAYLQFVEYTYDFFCLRICEILTKYSKGHWSWIHDIFFEYFCDHRSFHTYRFVHNKNIIYEAYGTQGARSFTL